MASTAVEKMKTLCRTCGKTADPSYSLLDPSHALLARWLTNSLSLKISTGNNYPTQLCLPCVDKIRRWVVFKERIRKAQRDIGDAGKTSATATVSPADPVQEPFEEPPRVADTSSAEARHSSVIPQRPSTIANTSGFSFVTPTSKIAIPSITRKRSKTGTPKTSLEKWLEASLSQNLRHQSVSKGNTVAPLTSSIENTRSQDAAPRKNASRKAKSACYEKKKCATCGKIVCNKYHLQRHIETVHLHLHTTTDIFCDFCNKSFKIKTTLQEHISRLHLNQSKTYQCKHCPGYFKNKHYLSYHVCKHHGAGSQPGGNCKICSKYFKYRIDLRQHVKHVHKRKYISCEQCQKKFYMATRLIDHIERHHSRGAKLYRCKLCRQRTQTKLDARKHATVVHKLYGPHKTDETYYKMTDAEIQNSKDEPELESSSESLKEEPGSRGDIVVQNNVICPAVAAPSQEEIIKARFPELKEMRVLVRPLRKQIVTCLLPTVAAPEIIDDIKQDTQKVSMDPPTPVPSSMTKSTPAIPSETTALKMFTFKCPLCPSGQTPCFPNERLFSNHLRKGHNKSSKAAKKYIPKSIPCNVCDKSFPDWCRYKVHTALHLAPRHECKLCHKKFPFASGLVSHELFHHTTAKKYTCGHCNKKLKTRSTLITHVTNVHLSELADKAALINKCKECGNVYTNPMYLKAHVKRMHSGKAKTAGTCQHCGKAFNSLVRLYHHTRRVHGSKNFKCDKCEKQYHRSRDLKTHMERFHGDGKKRYECKECTRKFAAEKNLKEHVRTIHKNLGKRLYVCEICDIEYLTAKGLQKHFRNIHVAGKKTTSNRFSCKICSTKFTTKLGIERHVEGCHKKIVALICNFCNEKFRSKKLIQSHIKDKHLKQTFKLFEHNNIQLSRKVTFSAMK